MKKIFLKLRMWQVWTCYNCEDSRSFVARTQSCRICRRTTGWSPSIRGGWMVGRKKTVDEHGRDEGMNYLLSMIGFQCVCHLVLHRMMHRLGGEDCNWKSSFLFFSSFLVCISNIYLVDYRNRSCFHFIHNILGVHCE